MYGLEKEAVGGGDTAVNNCKPHYSIACCIQYSVLRGTMPDDARSVDTKYVTKSSFRKGSTNENSLLHLVMVALASRVHLQRTASPVVVAILPKKQGYQRRPPSFSARLVLAATELQ